MPNQSTSGGATSEVSQATRAMAATKMLHRSMRTEQGSQDQLQNRQTKFLKAKFQVGSFKGDKVNYRNDQVVFSTADTPLRACVAKKEANLSKDPDILGVRKQIWNSSTNLKLHHSRKDLPRQLQKVRSGLLDQTAQASSISTRPQSQIADYVRYLVSITGHGPVGKFTKQWALPLDERGLPAHCVEPSWPDWCASTSTKSPEDNQLNQRRFEEREAQRLRMNVPAMNINIKKKYKNPEDRADGVNEFQREMKIEQGELKRQFKEQLRAEFPKASNERLDALAHRLLFEKLLADAKISKYPVPNESFTPSIALTTTNRRYKEFHHPGTWSVGPDGVEAWSCCMSEDRNSRGCEIRVVNPDRWCTLHA